MTTARLKQQVGADSALTLALEEQLCFALYAASRAVTALYRPMLEDLGLTYPQYLVMLVLWDRGAVPVKKLADALHLDYGTLSPLLKRLEANGHVRRARRSDDERSVQIILTDTGHALKTRAERLPRIIADAMDLGPESLATLHATLDRLAESVAANTSARPAA